MFEPKVSILIPCYNQEDVITQTVLSALNQTYENIEVIVSDDASTDETPNLLIELQKKFPDKLKILLNDTNVGVTQNHTRGLFECSGEFITFLDGDDIFLPEKIKKQVAFIQKRPSCTICYHDVDVLTLLQERVCIYGLDALVPDKEALRTWYALEISYRRFP